MQRSAGKRSLSRRTAGSCPPALGGPPGEPKAPTELRDVAERAHWTISARRKVLAPLPTSPKSRWVVR